MRILYGSGNILVSPKMTSGASTQIIGFVEALEQLGHQVDLDISGDQKLYPQIRTRPWLSWARKHFPPIWLAYEMLQVINNQKIRRRIQTIQPGDYDLLWQRYELFTTAYVKRAVALGLPAVLFLDAPLIDERRQYSYFWLKGTAIRALKENVRTSSAVVAISESVADYVRKYTDQPKLPILIMPNGFTPHILEAAPEAVQSLREKYFGAFRGTVIGFVGSPMKYHRLDTLMHIAHRLSKERDDFRVLIVGDGPDLPDQRQLCQELDLNRVVQFTGGIPFQDIAPYLHLLDIGVMPNYNLYGSPMKIVEYMACGAVVVAPDLLPIAELCVNEVEGLLFPQDNEDALAARLCWLLDDPALLSTLRQRAKTKALAAYSWEARLQVLDPLFKRLGSRKTSGSSKSTVKGEIDEG